MMGMAFRQRNCWGRLPPKRRPFPPATTIATFIRLGSGVADTRQRGGGLNFAQGATRAFTIAAVLSFIENFSKNHFAGRSLQDTRDRDISVLTDQTARVINYYHRAVIEVCDTLIVFLSLFENENAHRLAWQDDRLEAVGEFIDVQNIHAAKLSDLIQIEIICDDYGVELFAEFDQFQIHFPH